MHQVRYAHCEGYTEVCYAIDADNKKEKICTTGEDGDLRIWSNFDDTDQTSITVGDKCFCVAHQTGKLYVSDDLNELKKYDLATQEFEGVVTSFTLPITCVAINKSNTHLVCGSADFDLHLIELSTLQMTSFQGHDAPILSVCYDPLEKYFASTSCDATCRFWSIQHVNSVKTLSNLYPKSNDFLDSASRARIAWHKDGGLVALPSQKEIAFYERETWLLKFKIDLSSNESGESDDEFVASIVCFSPDGLYVLATTSRQQVYIHSIINKSLVYKYAYKKNVSICSLAWNPHNEKEILFCDTKGQLGLIKPSIKENSDSLEPPVEAKKKKSDETSTSTSKASSESKKKSSSGNDDQQMDMDNLLHMLEDDDSNSNDSSTFNKKKKQEAALKSPKKKRARVSDDEESSRDSATGDGDEDGGCIEEELENNQDDDDDVMSLEKLKEQTYKSVEKEIEEIEHQEANDVDADEDLVDDEFTTKGLEKTKQMTMTLLQSAFQPGSTSLSFTERYMCWNSVGVITQFKREDSDNDSIEIEFHNATHHHNIHMKNHNNEYTMASMSTKAIVLASHGKSSSSDMQIPEEDMDMCSSSHSKLTCIQLNNACDSQQNNNKEWSVDMPRKENIKCVCASATFVACATSRRFIRVFQTAGSQREILCVPGIPLAMTAYANRIFVAYHSSPISIGYSIFSLFDDNSADCGQQQPVETGVIPISGGDSRLEWIGFSDEGNPYCYDSHGMLFMKYQSKKNSKSPAIWTPIANMRAKLTHRSDHYWMIGVAERNQNVKAVHCKCTKYPQVLPRPNLALVPMRIPFVEPDNEKTQLEADYWKQRYLSLALRTYEDSTSNENGINQLEIDNEEMQENIEELENGARGVLMKLYMLACKTSKEQRAYELATLMDLSSMQLAIKYATKTRALVLAQSLNLLAERKAQADYERELAEQEQQQQQQQQNYVQVEQQQHQNQQSNNHFHSIADRASSDDNNSNAPVIISSRKETQQENDASINIVTDTQDDDLSTTTTPKSLITSTVAPRINPFAKSNKPSTPLNDSSKSIINEIETKITQSASGKGRHNDSWRPTPPSKKLTKSKFAAAEPSPKNMSPFFSR